MNLEPRSSGDYSPRQVQAAHRVLVDLGQVLAQFEECIVIIGGWVPDLLLATAEEPHIGSIDVDLALDAAKLNDGRYAALLNALLDTRRYRKGNKTFQLLATVDLEDDGPTVQVEVDFLAPKEVKLQKNNPKLIPDFRVLQTASCIVAFQGARRIDLSGEMINGAHNSVHLKVASVPDFLIMKAHAIEGRDKPKDVYDFCYCLDHAPGGIPSLAQAWKDRGGPMVEKSLVILREKFASVESYGPRQLAEFHDDPDPGTRAIHTRRAFEAVTAFLRHF